MRRCIPGLALTAILALCPAWAMADQATANRIAEALRASGKLVDYKIGVKFDDNGTATLLGRVANAAQMQQAIATTAELPYVKSVVNQLEIASSAPKAESMIPATADESGVELTAARRERIPHPLRGFRSPAGDPKQLDHTPPRVSSRTNTKLADSSTAQPLTVDAADPLAKANPVQFAAAPPSRRYAEEPLGSPIQQTSLNMGHRHHGAPCPSCPSGMSMPTSGYGAAAYDAPYMPNHAWPSYAAYPNYAAVSYPKQYSATAWPYIGPFYPYPQVPLGWRKVTLEWDDGWWFLQFKDKHRHH